MSPVAAGDVKRTYAQGLAFLLGYSVLAALLNYLTNVKEPDPVQEGPAFWVVAAGWTLILLFYLPMYGSLVYSVRQWDWTFDEWGFGTSRRTWFAIGPALAILALAWLVISSLGPSRIRLPALDNLKTAFLQTHLAFLVFQGYARVAEEVLYRGFAIVLFRRMFARTHRGTLWAVLLSSALFALVHTHKPDQVLQLFLGAAVPLAAITMVTRSISFALVLHGLAGGGHIGALYALVFFAAVALYNVKVRKRPCSCGAVDRT